MQTSIYRYLATGPLFGLRQEAEGAVDDSARKIEDYTAAIRGRRDHADTHYNEREQKPGDLMKQEFFTNESQAQAQGLHAEIAAVSVLAPDEVEKERRAALQEIAHGLLANDKEFLIDRGGRPVGEASTRDRWSSFIIDFAVLNKGDGFFTWKGLPAPYQQLFTEALTVMQELDPDTLRDIAKKYLDTHPDLEGADRAQVEVLV